MMYHVFSPEHVHMKPSPFADKRSDPRKRRLDSRANEEVMTFSSDFNPAWLNERGDSAPVYVPQRRNNPTRTVREPQLNSPVSTFDTGRVPLVSRRGVTMTVALVLVTIMLVLAGVVTLSYHVTINATNHQYEANMARAEELETAAFKLQQEINAKLTESEIANAAIGLGMERVRSSDVIYLAIPEDVVCSLPTDATVGSSYYASNPGD